MREKWIEMCYMFSLLRKAKKIGCNVAIKRQKVIHSPEKYARFAFINTPSGKEYYCIMTAKTKMPALLLLEQILRQEER